MEMGIQNYFQIAVSLMEKAPTPNSSLPNSAAPRRFALTSHTAWQECDDKILVVNASNGETFFLEGSEREIWLAIVQGLNDVEIVRELRCVFLQDQDRLWADLESFTSQLVIADLIGVLEILPPGS